VIVILFLLVLFWIQVQSQPGFRVQGKQNQFIYAQFDDPQILIENNTEFEIWPGNGSLSNPFMIENLMISGRDSYYGFYCLTIHNTDSYFVVKNCTFKIPGDSYGNVIRLYNVTNGIIENCTIIVEEYENGYEGDGIDLYASANIQVRDCRISGGLTGIELWQSVNCVIKSNILSNQRYEGIQTIFSNDTVVSDNILLGAGVLDSYSGVEIAGGINISVYSNSITNFWICGIRLEGAADNSVSDNHVTTSGAGIFVNDSNKSRVDSNILSYNENGIVMESRSYNNTISSNVLGYNEKNARDNGFNNHWSSNWYSDFQGNGYYIIPGSSKSVDASPQPTTLHVPDFISSIMVLLMICLIPLGAAIGFQMRYREIEEQRLGRGPSLFFMVLSIALPCGISSTPLPDMTLPNLRFVLVDILFAIGVSRAPGSDWSLNYYNSSIITGDDMLFFITVPYLLGGLITIGLLMTYLKRQRGGKLFAFELLAITVILMIIAQLVSVLLIPITPLLAISIIFWVSKMRIIHRVTSPTS
jgi:parallel beta-helix repeat protein